MGKRGRRKARESEDAARPATSQHMARVNIEDEWWKAVRMEAVRTNISVAAYLSSTAWSQVRNTISRFGALEDRRGHTGWRRGAASRRPPWRTRRRVR